MTEPDSKRRLRDTPRRLGQSGPREGRKVSSQVLAALALGLAAFFMLLGAAALAGWHVGNSSLPRVGAQFLLGDRSGAVCLVLSSIALAAAAVLFFRATVDRDRSRHTKRLADEHETKLQLSEERYRTLVQAATTFFGTTDASGALASYQEGWQQYTGQSWDEYEGYGWVQAVHPDDRDRVLHVWREALELHCNFRLECRIWHAASEAYHFCEAVAVPLINPDDTVREWICALRDIDNDVKRITRELRESARDQRSDLLPDASPHAVSTGNDESSV